MAAVVFDYQAWATRYPELAVRAAEPLATAFFEEAGIVGLVNDDSVIADEAKRAVILNMITAHICALNAPLADGQDAAPLVGRISSATQGSVTVQATLDIAPGTAQWWAQTRYGLSAWTALRNARGFRYVPGRGRSTSPYIGGFPRG